MTVSDIEGCASLGLGMLSFDQFRLLINRTLSIQWDTKISPDWRYEPIHISGTREPRRLQVVGGLPKIGRPPKYTTDSAKGEEYGMQGRIQTWEAAVVALDRQ